ncbi:hypothetical protein BpHYR1_040602 [Brachionus plicatilis]|nr:hypothetical protein BpHYR1_040602 [Brachionus plicatilis]
MNTTQNS